MKRLVSMFGTVVVFVTLFLSVTAYAGTGDVTITFWGQSAFKLESGGKTILIDPWITGNPAAPIKVGDITRADLIFVTHDHFDHVGDTIAISMNTGAMVVCEYETAKRLIAEGLPPDHILFNGFGKPIGGPLDVNGITVVSTPAMHSSDSGVSMGYIFTFPDGPTVYHAGDTAIFSDMQIYGDLYPMDMALLPIGGYATMDAVQAAKSLRLLTPKKTIPMHYGTFPMLAPNADEFVRLAKKTAPEVDVIVLKPGESTVLMPAHHHHRETR